MPVCTVGRATQRLRCTNAVLLLQPQHKCQHQAWDCSVHRRWARDSCAVYVSTSVAGPVQYEWEGHDLNGHVLASDLVGSNWMHLHLWEGQIRYFQDNKSSKKGKKGKKCPGTNSTVRVPKKVHFEKHWDLCKNHGGAHTTHNASDCHRFEKDRREKSSFWAAKKDRYYWNPVNQNFAQLTNKIKKLEKALKKSGKKGKKRH